MFSQKSALAWHDGCLSCEWHMRPLVELLQSFAVATPSDRRDFLEALVRECHVRELSDLEAMLLPRLKVDFLQRLPMDVALHILTFLDDPRALACTAAVSRTWHHLSMNEYLWSLMCVRQKYHTPDRLRWLTHRLLGDAPSTSRAAAMDVDGGLLGDVGATRCFCKGSPAHRRTAPLCRFETTFDWLMRWTATGDGAGGCCVRTRRSNWLMLIRTRIGAWHLHAARWITSGQRWV